ncbi:MAG: hypothetical protein QOI98_646, partial [Solirubrobacteraceae bacterium]|nr:hypothetical protein [Solirubrobacteraceae bacterium]
SDAITVNQVAERLQLALDEPFAIEDIALAVRASIGIAMHPDHADDVETLMQRADIAMYRAKDARSGHEFYAAATDNNTVDRLAMVAELRAGIESGELILHYQPQVDLPSGNVPAVEALVRWQHPTRGLVSPAEFIPLAEHAGLIRPLTARVLDDALRQCRLWLDDGIAVRVAVNLSARSLLDDGLPNEVARLLAGHELGAEHLGLEITESVIMADPARAIEVLRRLGEMGIRLGIDDFGTGYSSLGYLRRLDVDEIKIDRSFVLGMATEADDRQIVHSIVDLGHNLGLAVVAEGVEDESTLLQLRRLGCDSAQGYHLSRPLAPSNLTPWLRVRAPRVEPAVAGLVAAT